MKVIGIIRVSTDEQAGENGEGLERQRKALEVIEERLRQSNPDLIVLPPIEVHGVSGSDLFDTPEWRGRIAPALNAGAHLMADSVDRVVRASHFDFRTLQALTNAKGRLYTASDTFDTTNGGHRFTLSVFASAGGLQKSEIIRVAQAGKEAKRRRGIWVGRLNATPTGTVFDRPNKRWTYNEKAPRVLEAFRAFEAGASLRELAADLGMSPPGVRALLANDIFRGLFIVDEKRGEKYASVDGRQAGRKKILRTDDVIEVRVYGGPGQEPQLVSDDLFAAVQQKLAAMNGQGRKRKEHAAPQVYLSALLFSHYEGMPQAGGIVELDLGAKPTHIVYGDTTVGRPARYECRCRSSTVRDPNAPRPKCALRMLRAEWVNRGVDRYLHEITVEGWGVDQIRKQLDRKGPGNVERDENRLKKALADVDRKERIAKEALLDGDVTKEDHRKRVAKLRLEREELQKQLAGLEKHATVDLDAIRQAWVYDRSWDTQAKRTWIARWCRNIQISNEGIESITLRLPGADGSPVVFYGGLQRSWRDLTGADIQSVEGRMAAEGRFTAGEVLRRLGWDVGPKGLMRLHYLIRSGQLPKPEGRWGQKSVWTEREFAVLRDLVEKKGLHG